MSKKGVIYLFIFLIFSSINSSIAQNTSKEIQPLTDILTGLEAQYNINFTYVDQTIEDISIIRPDKNFSLEELLDYLKTYANLDFILIDNYNVVISKRINPLSKFITQKLEEIVITNYLTKGISRKSDGKTTIKTEDFGILPGLIEPDILQTIQALPGILSVDETVSNINVRGGTHDQNLILWDGIKMYQSGHFFGLVSAFNPYLTTDINVSKNGTSVIYGDGVSSVIDMQQTNSLDQDFKSGAGFNLIHADGFAKVPLTKQAEIQLSARRSVTDFIFTPTYDQYLQRVFQDSDFSNSPQNSTQIVSNNERFYFYDIAAKLLYDITDQDQIRFNFSTINNSLTYDQLSIADENVSLTNTLEQNNFAAGVQYLKYWNSKLTTTAQVYISNYDLIATDFDVINNQRQNQENKVKDLGIKINATNHIDDNLKLHGGYQFNEVIISNFEEVDFPDFTSFVKEVNRTHSIYGEAEFTSADKNTYARIGIRTNFIEKFSEFFTEPRLSVSHKLSNNFRLEFLAEFKSQTTSQIIDLQNDFLGIEKRRWILSNNEDIPIIKSAQGAFGIHYNKNKLFISAEAFIKNVKGITSRSQGFQNQFQFVNDIGKYQVLGIDFLINKQFETFSTWLSYSFSNNNYTFDNINNNTAFRNNLDVRHAVTFASTYAINNLNLALGFNWHSGKPTTLPTEVQNTANSSIEYKSPNSTNLSSYFRTDMSITYKLKFGKKLDASIGASIWNVFDRRNIINTYFAEDENGEIVSIDNLSLGVTPNISFRVRF
ncbi:TonB-dependent receptor plug domain-containing protein [Psychroserpens ponticola]|uniref:TonB-dependent receptor plug domain-containing protein n=1 Tax=Psychroserpens ponticola TaxID=2932268 RepID=A0ABY7S3A9_9FLAO|nr:TonB-dependent receptor plug domain-containing protein [Psychroserpens ponticola]WCO02400.1 TonB-dependent receptor plug domain-containing protein [Psychroserpens ponticola]